MQKNNELIPHLFRTEFSKISSVLSKLFGIEHMEVAEDIASETFLAALETWTYKGIPENPTAWLYTTAKNKARNYFTRNKLFVEKISSELKYSSEHSQEIEIDLSAENITDSLLQMLFAICYPAISAEAQIALSLRILCGFGIDEIASAFLTSKETINKRLVRAREKLRTDHVEIKLPSEVELNDRLETVLTTLYLLFNEGYYSESNEAVLRHELCDEAMRLTTLLLDNNLTNKPQVNALYALMCFHASRFEARKNNHGEIILYNEQDESLWDRALITKGALHLKQASEGNIYSKYHLEASIAYWMTVKSDTKEKWENVLQLHNHLLKIAYSPMAALNRTYALYKANGTEQAIIEAEKLKLENNRFYFLLLAELYKGTDNHRVRTNLEKALKLTKTDAERQTILKKIEVL
ncbi:RNA polymerase sigma factor [Fulvivirga ligni]|uniref:RNA polymerase sigma factor n=1 Tax=Fulvivirga ligni TaxID=2904246 RepID=UPI001F3EC791|nr:sigma-70 family RNA polymerase sigma factor [Fulvivirga ligni]UII20519.1 sigma-70 family RNA polymerase sigma factor [Fulvivirga ligni]